MIISSRKSQTTTDYLWHVKLNNDPNEYVICINRDMYTKLLFSCKMDDKQHDILTSLSKKFNIFPAGLNIKLHPFKDHHIVTSGEIPTDVRGFSLFIDSILDFICIKHDKNIIIKIIEKLNKKAKNNIVCFNSLKTALSKYDDIFVIFAVLTKFYNYICMAMTIMTDVDICQDKELKQYVKCSDIVHIATNYDNYSEFVVNPYTVNKISFNICDRFAVFYKVPLIVKLIENVANQIRTKMLQGHTCYDVHKIIYLLKENTIHTEIKELTKEYIYDVIETHDKFSLCDKYIYMRYVYEMETRIVKKFSDYIEQTNNKELKYKISKECVEDFIKEYEDKHPPTRYDSVQRLSIIQTFMVAGILLITGGPGTGKSEVIKCICYIIDQLNMSCILCAPTGKAAMRLGEKGMTIHRALQTQVTTGSNYMFKKNGSNLIKDNFMIIDETSMLDLALTYATCEACSSYQTRLILIGDAHQLPSVSFGNILRDLIKTGIVPHIQFKKVYRQTEGCTILKVAKSIVQGTVPSAQDLNSLDVNHFDSMNTDRIRNKMWEIIDSTLNSSPQKLDKDIALTRIQVLLPTKRGPVGTFEINKFLHSKIYDCDLDDYHYRPNEKMICTSNTYVKDQGGEIIIECSAMNGESGMFMGWKGKDKLILNITTGKTSKTVEVEKSNIEMGHGITIHKSQGSEFDIIIIVVHKSHGMMLNREVFYTGCTRAKKKLYILGDMESIQKCVETPSMQRVSFLNKRICDEFE